MKFGKVEHPETVDFSLPKDHPNTKDVFEKYGGNNGLPPIYIGCAKWNKTDLKNFYPKGIKEELPYYAQEFNCIELNATFYQRYAPEQYEKWYHQTPDNFVFFPKITQQISHYRQLKNVDELVDEFLFATSHLKEKLGTIFLQLNARYTPNHLGKLQHFVEYWPDEVPLSVEVRHEDWFSEEGILPELAQLLEENGVQNTLVDTAGRRDMVHMQLTNPRPFIRYVGANCSKDYSRIDEWVERIKMWIDQGMEELQFFVHQNMEKESPMMAVYMIEKLNQELGYDLHVPKTLKRPEDSEYLKK